MANDHIQDFIEDEESEYDEVTDEQFDALVFQRLVEIGVPLRFSIYRRDLVNVDRIIYDSGAHVDALLIPFVTVWITSLQWAAFIGADRIVMHLHRRMATLDLVNETGHTALHFAALGKQSSTVELLLKLGANPNILQDGLYSPLSYSCLSGDIRTARILLPVCSEETWNEALYSVVMGENIGRLAKDSLGLRIETPFSHDPAIICLLDPSLVGITRVRRVLSGELEAASEGSFLEVAIVYQVRSAVELLIDMGAEVNTPGHRSINMLSLAVSRQMDDEAAEYMVLHGAAVDDPGAIDVTPLSWAVLARREDTVRMLLYYGADVDAMSEKGMTALFHAIMTNQIGMMHLLIRAGASTNLTMGSDVINDWEQMFAPTYSVENFREGVIPRVFAAVGVTEEEEDFEFEEEASSEDEELHESFDQVEDGFDDMHV